MNAFPLLSLLIGSSLVGGIIILFCQKLFTPLKKLNAVRYLSLLISFFCFYLSLLLLQGFESELWQMQWQEESAWIPSLGIRYALGVDGFSLPLIILTTLMTVIVVIASFSSVKNKISEYLSAFLVMQGLIIGALSALDSILFYIFWEGMLIPMFLIIGIWGGQNRIYATIKFFLYTFLGSVLFLIALIVLHFKALESGVPLQESFNILTFHSLPLTLSMQQWIFFAFLIAFAVKVPMWPVHTWLPDAHVEAPSGGSVILAAILLKMGGYGFLRFMLPITPDASTQFAIPMIFLSLIAVIYIGLVTIVQRDMKKLIAYSSISHMGFVTLGFFVTLVMINNKTHASLLEGGIQGGMIQMISHGFVSAALFLCVGVLYDRVHSRLIKDYGGVVKSMPIFASFFMLFAMANVGLPGTSGFVGEFFVILSAFQANLWYALSAVTLLILGASYTLWMVKRVVLGSPHHAEIDALPDLYFNEKCSFIILAIMILWLGLWPAPLLNFMEATVGHLIEQVTHSKLGA